MPKNNGRLSTALDHEAGKPVVSQFAHHIPNQTICITKLCLNNKRGALGKSREDSHLDFKGLLLQSKSPTMSQGRTQIRRLSTTLSSMKPTRLHFSTACSSYPKSETIWITKNSDWRIRKRGLERAQKIQCWIQRPSLDQPKRTAQNPADPNRQIPRTRRCQKPWLRLEESQLGCVSSKLTRLSTTLGDELRIIRQVWRRIASGWSFGKSNL